MLRWSVVLSLASAVSGMQLGGARLSTPTTRCTIKALVTPEDMVIPATTFLLSGIGEAIGLGPGYGGKSAFSETASAQNGDLNGVIALAVIFPTVVTLAFFKDNILDAFAPDPYSEDELPPGWRKVPSKSRPGQFSFEQTTTKDRYDRLPPAARKGLM